MISDEDRDWILQLRPDRWVVWKYAEDHPTENITPEKINLVDGMDIWLCFNLEKERSDQYPNPVELYRKDCWAWRFLHVPSYSSSGWHLSGSQDDAVTDAREYARTTHSLRHSERHIFLDACESPVVMTR